MKVSTQEEADEIEILLIACHKYIGDCLTNNALGGKYKKQFHSDDTKARISASQKGRKLNPEHVEKIAASNRGRKHTLEARSNMSVAHVGKSHSPETRAKMSISQSRRRLLEATAST